MPQLGSNRLEYWLYTLARGYNYRQQACGNNIDDAAAKRTHRWPLVVLIRKRDIMEYLPAALDKGLSVGSMPASTLRMKPLDLQDLLRSFERSLALL